MPDTSTHPDRSYTWHSDPGHAWLAVPLVDLLALGVRVQPEGEHEYDAAAVSRFSYVSRDGLTVYLEEDCDAGAFLAPARAAGWDFELVEGTPSRGDSFIRAMSSASALGSAILDAAQEAAS